MFYNNLGQFLQTLWVPALNTNTIVLIPQTIFSVTRCFCEVFSLISFGFHRFSSVTSNLGTLAIWAIWGHLGPSGPSRATRGRPGFAKSAPKDMVFTMVGDAFLKTVSVCMARTLSMIRFLRHFVRFFFSGLFFRFLKLLNTPMFTIVLKENAPWENRPKIKLVQLPAFLRYIITLGRHQKKATWPEERQSMYFTMLYNTRPPPKISQGARGAAYDVFYDTS